MEETAQVLQFQTHKKFGNKDAVFSLASDCGIDVFFSNLQFISTLILFIFVFAFIFSVITENVSIVTSTIFIYKEKYEKCLFSKTQFSH